MANVATAIYVSAMLSDNKCFVSHTAVSYSSSDDNKTTRYKAKSKALDFKAKAKAKNRGLMAKTI